MAIRKQAEGYRELIAGLRRDEDSVFDMFKTGAIDAAEYERQRQRCRDKADEHNRQLEQLNLAISDAGMIPVKRMFELAINATSLWKNMERHQKLEYLKEVCSNPTLDALTVQYQLEKPFARLASMKQNSEWRRERDSNS